MRIPPSLSTYQRSTASEPALPLLNRYFEQNPTNLIDGVALLSRPFTDPLVVAGTGPIRAMQTQKGAFSDALFVVSGNAFYRVDTDNTVTQITGTIAGTGVPQIAIRADGVFVCDGTNLQYYDGVLGSLQSIAVPDSAGIVSIDILAQHVLCVVSNSQRFYWITPGTFTIDALNFAEAEQLPDNIIRVRVVDDTAWFFGDTSSEQWYANPAATDETLRFLRQEGVAYSQGIVEGTDVELNNEIILIGNDERVYRIAGRPVRVSNHYIEQRIREALAAERAGP